MSKVITPAPNTNLGAKRTGAIDARYEKQISALNPGQVTEVLEDPQGLVIYKVDAKRTIPLDTVRKDIENSLQRQRFDEKMKQLLGSVKADFNESYFGAGQQPHRWRIWAIDENGFTTRSEWRVVNYLN